MTPEAKIPGSPLDACAFCGMGFNKDGKITREYLNEVYFFCSEPCAKQFLENPRPLQEEEDE